MIVFISNKKKTHFTIPNCLQVVAAAVPSATLQRPPTPRQQPQPPPPQRLPSQPPPQRLPSQPPTTPPPLLLLPPRHHLLSSPPPTTMTSSVPVAVVPLVVVVVTSPASVIVMTMRFSRLTTITRTMTSTLTPTMQRQRPPVCVFIPLNPGHRYTGAQQYRETVHCPSPPLRSTRSVCVGGGRLFTIG